MNWKLSKMPFLWKVNPPCGGRKLDIKSLEGARVFAQIVRMKRLNFPWFKGYDKLRHLGICDFTKMTEYIENHLN